MAQSFFFYDLETSGFNPREARVMQFAGQRTDMELRPIGEPVDVLIKMSADTVPDPDAVMITGITPQATIADGISEADFLRLFFEQVVQPDTIFLGYNSVRFDDEFMRFLLYRNFYDAYEWQWADNCSRWDLLDVVRMTRALRPEGIVWPFNEEGKATNRLELLTKANGLAHSHAHDALDDVQATIAVARLIRDKQPKLFNYLLDCRHKKEVEKLVCQDGKPFVYASGHFPSQSHKTTVAVKVADTPRAGGCLVYNLRHDPTEFINMPAEQLADRWQWDRNPAAPARLPIKELKFNRCPAVAPIAVLDSPSQARLQLDMQTVRRHLQLLQSSADFKDRLSAAFVIKDTADRERWPSSQAGVDGQLYDGNFLTADDKHLQRAIRAASPTALSGFVSKLHDERLKQLIPLYKARNFPDSMTGDERQLWDGFVRERLLSGGQQSRLAKYFDRLQELSSTVSGDQAYLLEELQLYGQSVMPVYDGEYSE